MIQQIKINLTNQESSGEEGIKIIYCASKHMNILRLRLGFLQRNWSHKIGIKKISRSSYIHSSICTKAAKHVGRRPWHRARFQSPDDE